MRPSAAHVSPSESPGWFWLRLCGGARVLVQARRIVLMRPMQDDEGTFTAVWFDTEVDRFGRELVTYATPEEVARQAASTGPTTPKGGA